MKVSTMTVALAAALAVPAFAQQPAARNSRTTGPASAPGATAQPGGNTTQGTRDPKVFKSGDVLPGPEMPADAAQPAVTLPNEPIEPYLVTKDAGPFMVLAQTFRGPDAARYALALVLELRRDFNMPAWIFYPKVQPMHSLIRNIPPTAPEYLRTADMTMPEKARIYDEAAVLVGNCKTTEESQKLLNRVKRIRPKCFENMPAMMPWRQGKGLSRALRTTNPLVPAQFLYPSKGDPVVRQMNQGPFSLFNCPGRYTLQVREFAGRASFDPKDAKFGTESHLRTSPLMTAADNAQKLAEALAKDDAIVKTGYKPYVYHDRYSSKVTIGSFSAPNDPAAASLRQMLLTSGELQNRLVKKGLFVLVPASELMDLQTLPPH